MLLTVSYFVLLFDLCHIAASVQIFVLYICKSRVGEKFYYPFVPRTSGRLNLVVQHQEFLLRKKKPLASFLSQMEVIKTIIEMAMVWPS